MITWEQHRDEYNRRMYAAGILWRETTGTIIDPITLRIIFAAADDVKEFKET